MTETFWILDDAADVGRGKMGLGVWLIPRVCLLTDEERESEEVACAMGRGLISGAVAETGPARSAAGGGDGKGGGA